MDERDECNFGKRFSEEFSKVRREIKRPNILVMGATGAGKSSLVNMIFGQELATVGAGKPITQGVCSYENELVRIYDSEGYESGQEQQARFKARVLGFIEQHERDISASVHMVWYCISQANHRVFDIDLETISAVALKVPLAVVMTQADRVSEANSKQMLATVQGHCPGVTIFEVSTDPGLPLSVDPLIEWSYDKLSAALRVAFISASKRAIKLKRDESIKVVEEHSTVAAATALSPVPFSDVLLLVSNQMAMLARLASIWNLPGLQAVASGGVGMLATQLGRTLAGNVAKFIPGVGSLVGGAMNVTAAVALTYAIGYATTEICEQIAVDELNGRSMKNLSEYFSTKVMAEKVRQSMQRGDSHA